MVVDVGNKGTSFEPYKISEVSTVPFSNLRQWHIQQIHVHVVDFPLPRMFIRW
jgi:hypothetical protein